MDLGALTNGITSYGSLMTQSSTDSASLKSESVKAELNSLTSDSTDEELMDACKSFESYMITQLFKEMRQTVHSEDEDNEYISMFGDTLYEQYSNEIANSQSLGIAKTLFDSIKRNDSK